MSLLGQVGPSIGELDLAGPGPGHGPLGLLAEVVADVLGDPADGVGGDPDLAGGLVATLALA
jgi:hypothetical protein